MKRAIAVLLLASCGPSMDPETAWRIEMKQCEKREDAESQRRCEALVHQKYAHYFAESDYPSSPR